jgi:Bacterial PH domain
MKVFTSKIDWWFGLVLLYPIFRSMVGILEGDWLGYLGIVLIAVIIVFFSKTTQYIVNDTQLVIQCMFIVNEKIDIRKIRKIEKTSNMLSSPALSLDRIAIKYNTFDEIYISPKEKQFFIDELLLINPTIEVAI